jgi:hypothetical protein
MVLTNPNLSNHDHNVSSCSIFSRGSNLIGNLFLFHFHVPQSKPCVKVIILPILIRSEPTSPPRGGLGFSRRHWRHLGLLQHWRRFDWRPCRLIIQGCRRLIPIFGSPVTRRR